jgi:hypothetical protein
MHVGCQHNDSSGSGDIKLRQYRTSLHNRLKAIQDINYVEEEWERIKEAIMEAANEVIQTEQNPKKQMVG